MSSPDGKLPSRLAVTSKMTAHARKESQYMVVLSAHPSQRVDITLAGAIEIKDNDRLIP